MKILLINKHLYPKGGAPKSTLATGELLRRKGHQVAYWGMSHPDNPDYTHKNLFVNYVDLVNGGGLVRQLKTAANIFYSFEAKQKIRKLIGIDRPDIVHLNNFAHQISPSILDIFDKLNIPTVMTFRDYKLVCPAYSMFCKNEVCEKCKGGNFYHCFINKCTHDSRIKSFVNMLEMYLHHKILHIYNKIDAFISPSMFLRNKLKEMGFDREIEYLPNFTDFDTSQSLPECDNNCIVYFGRLSKEKGLFTLLDAVKDIKVQLKIIGDGPIRTQLEEKVATEKISNVVFTGYKKSEELKREIQNSAATITPSECYENNPRTIIESFALGKPVIGARIGGIPELVIDGKTGYTFEPGNAVDLKSKIESLISNPDKCMQMGKNARKYVEEGFNSEKHYEKLMEIYQSAIDKRDNSNKTRKLKFDTAK